MEWKNERRLFRSAWVGRRGAIVLAAGAASVAALTVGAGIVGAAQGSKFTVVRTSDGGVLSDGKTVYVLKGNVPCNAGCLIVWPAVVLPKGVKHPTAGSGVSASKLGTVKVSGGNLQVTYGGKRLYFFTGDTARGDVNGNVTDTWGKWTAVVVSKPSGSGSGSSTSTTSGSGSSNAGSGGASF
jgi:predicted lipoprotein with Yx(FWY)xxD motif